MKNIKAYIKQDTKNSESLWLVVEGSENTAHPIMKDEVVAILEACQKYLEEVKH